MKGIPVVLWVIIAGLLLIAYFLPSTIATRRNHNSAGVVFLVNLLLGWTGIAWLIILIWACEGKAGDKEKGDWD